MGKPVPYIGVTGICTSAVAKYLQRFIPSYRNELLMMGVLVNDDTLKGSKSNRNPLRYPRIEQIESIFQNSNNLLNIIHFHSSDSSNLTRQLELLMKIGGPNLDGLQLNLTWPEPELINNFKVNYPNKKIILQINDVSAGRYSNSPVSIATKIKIFYEGIVDYVLIDKSMGTGKQFDQSFTIKCLEGIRGLMPEMGLVIAGGLNSKNLNSISEIIKLFPDVGVDVESGIRDADDRLDLYEAERFVKNAFDLLDPYKNQPINISL